MSTPINSCYLCEINSLAEDWYSGIWRRVFGLVVPDVSKDRSVFILKAQAVQEQQPAHVSRSALCDARNNSLYKFRAVHCTMHAL
jgi:hypothetical protein